MTTTHTFLGMEIEGDITRGAARKDQKPLEDLAPLLKAVLEEVAIAGIQWQQYTPYFNDGDPCVFRVSEFAVEFAGHPLTEEDEEFCCAEERSSGFVNEYTDLWRSLLGGETYVGRDAKNLPIYKEIEGSLSPNTAQRVSRLQSAIQGGSFNDVLLVGFGDHAQVTIRPGQPIQVEFYDHD